MVIGGLSVAIALGWCVAVRPWKWSAASGAMHAAGRVIRQESKLDDEIGRTYQPAVRYEVGGVSYETKGMGLNPPKYQVGAKVLVAYPPDQPGEGAIADDEGQWLPVAMFGGGGLLFSVIGWHVWRAERANRRPDRALRRRWSLRYRCRGDVARNRPLALRRRHDATALPGEARPGPASRGPTTTRSGSRSASRRTGRSMSRCIVRSIITCSWGCSSGSGTRGCSSAFRRTIRR